MKVTLTVYGQERDGEKFEFTEPGSFLFGRSAKSQCQIVHDPYVSQSHFILLINPPEVRLRNLSKTNGTMVDGVLYTQHGPVVDPTAAKTLVKHPSGEQGAEAILQEGSQIEAGYTRIKVTVEAPAYCTQCGRQISRVSEGGAIPMCDVCLSRRSEDKAQSIPQSERADHDRQASRATPKRAEGNPPDPSQQAARRRRDPLPAARQDIQDRPAQGEEDARGLLREVLRKLIRRPQIPGHRIGDKLTDGGMGVIHQAVRLRDNCRVALKMIRPDRPLTPEGRGRFKREIAIMASLNHPQIHPHIIPVYDSGEVDGELWYTMEFVEGGLDVQKYIDQNTGHPPTDECVQIILQALDGLAYAHDRGIVHRDLKPSNILLCGAAGSLTAKLTDFGIAKSLEDTGLNCSILTKKAAMGTLPYMPPEQMRDVRKCQPTADVFSIGATLYEMLSGRHTREFSRNINEAILQVLDEETVPLRNRTVQVSIELELVIERALKLEPDERFPHAGAFRDALKAVPESQ